MTTKNERALEALEFLFETLKDHHNEQYSLIECEKCVDVIRTALQQSAVMGELVEALEFYAETENYELMDMDDFGTCASKIDLDEGDKAKSIIAKLKGEKK